MRSSSKQNKHLLRRGSFNFGVVLLLSFLLSLFACYEPQEGCLDIEATNFNFSADHGCVDCCTYPSMEIRLKHSFGDTSLPFGSNYTLDSLHYFRLISWDFYVSGLQLCREGEKTGVLDTLDIYVSDNGMSVMETIEDNYARVSRTTFTLTMGTVRTSGVYDSLRFNVGVDATANRAIADSVNGGHPLAALGDTVNWNKTEGYFFHNIRFQRDTLDDGDTFNITIALDPNLVGIKLLYPQTINPGSNVSIPINIDYKEWLKGINFVDDSEELIKSKIVANTADAFSILE